MPSDSRLKIALPLLLLLASLLMLWALWYRPSDESGALSPALAAAGMEPPVANARELATPADSQQTQTSFKTVSKARPTKAPKDVVLNSLDELIALFDSLGYNQAGWQAGNREVPRLTFEAVSERWQKTSSQIPVQLKKMVFFRLMAPLILVANEQILLERRTIAQAAPDAPELLALARKYRLLTDESGSQTGESGSQTGESVSLTEEQRGQLLARVDIMPPSLVLAQAAEESGWATSRFTVEGNAFFGQWDFSGKGMTPKAQRKELGNHGLARFDTPLASVEGYLLNLNTNAAYQSLRSLRAQLRAENKPITGLELAGTLERYSERGQAYIDGIRHMIRYNGLDQVDEAYLSDGAPLHLISADDARD